ncbi:MAG: hypothetical protein KUG77_04560 [Nannocystaceae bacterium]|nr:hypothetical protein [Nannocystaceae bacterium]
MGPSSIDGPPDRVERVGAVVGAVVSSYDNFLFELVAIGGCLTVFALGGAWWLALITWLVTPPIVFALCRWVQSRWAARSR